MSYYLPCNPCCKKCNPCQYPACARCLPCSPCQQFMPVAVRGVPSDVTPDLPEPQYGGAYNSEPQKITAATAEDYTIINTDTAMPSNGVTLENNALVIPEDGDYYVSYSLNAGSAQDGELQALVLVNGNDAVPCSAVNEQSYAGTFGDDDPTTMATNAQNAFIVSLKAGDKLNLAVFFPNTSFYPKFVLTVYRNGGVINAVKLS